ncbi:MAG: barstar family protein [Hymenobacter sp.]|nr:barstar family protein [Hymenobacter sp.]
MKKVVLEGSSFVTVRDVHTVLAEALDFGPYYGFNPDALWDVLTTDVERPVIIEWKNSLVSEKRLGAEFEKIVDVLRRVVDFDNEMGFKEKIQLKLL